MDNYFVLGIGAAAGAQQSLKELFTALDPELPVSMVIVPHTDADHIDKIEEILSQLTHRRIKRLMKDTVIQKRMIYILPEEFSVKVEGKTLKVAPRLSANEPVIDIFFESLARTFKENATGMILSGKGKDGVKGALSISASGGHILVQEPFSALYQSLPREIIRVDHPEKVLPAVRLAALINKHFQQVDPVSS